MFPSSCVPFKICPLQVVSPKLCKCSLQVVFPPSFVPFKLCSLQAVSRFSFLLSRLCSLQVFSLQVLAVVNIVHPQNSNDVFKNLFVIWTVISSTPSLWRCLSTYASLYLVQSVMIFMFSFVFVESYVLCSLIIWFLILSYFITYRMIPRVRNRTIEVCWLCLLTL